MIKIAYFGYSKEMLENLMDDSRFELKVVVAKPGRISEEYVEIAKKLY